MARKQPMTAQAKHEAPWTCVDYWPASRQVYMSARRWSLFEQVMWSSPDLFLTFAEAKADVDHYNEGTMGRPFEVTVHTIKEPIRIESR